MNWENCHRRICCVYFPLLNFKVGSHSKAFLNFKYSVECSYPLWYDYEYDYSLCSEHLAHYQTMINNTKKDVFKGLQL